MEVPSPGCRAPVRSEGEDKGREQEGAGHSIHRDWWEGTQVEGVRPGLGLRCLSLTTLLGSREIPGAPCCAANLTDTGFKLGSSVLQ